jgi:hypothetical protein
LEAARNWVLFAGVYLFYLGLVMGAAAALQYGAWRLAPEAFPFGHPIYDWLRYGALAALAPAGFRWLVRQAAPRVPFPALWRVTLLAGAAGTCLLISPGRGWLGAAQAGLLGGLVYWAGRSGWRAGRLSEAPEKG